jgi:hypothetical protein
VRRRDVLALFGYAPLAWSIGVNAEPLKASRRVRPSDPGWPSEGQWKKLSKSVNGRLAKLNDPLAACRSAYGSADCKNFFDELRNPYFLSEDPALTETAGWIDAWTSKPSAYAVIAQNSGDIVAAVNFARRFGGSASDLDPTDERDHSA